MSEVGEEVVGESAAAAARKIDGLHVYGGAGALKFEVSRHQKETSRLVFMVDGSRNRVGREFDWTNKVTIQLTANEGLMVFAVLMRLVPAFETAPHGDSVKKLRIEDQGRNFFVRVSDRSQGVPVPVSPMDAAHLALLFGRGFLGLHPYLGDLDGLVRFVKTFVPSAQQTAHADPARPAAPSEAGRSSPAASQRSGGYAERRPDPPAAPQKADSQHRVQQPVARPKPEAPVGKLEKGNPAAPSGPRSSAKGHGSVPGPQAKPAQKFSVPATIAGIRQKTTIAELDRSLERVKATFSGDELLKCLQAIEARRAEITAAMA